MTQKNDDYQTEWIFCRSIRGKCSGLNPKTRVLEKVNKTIKVNGKEVNGWMVKIVQEKSEGHLNLNMIDSSDE